MKLATSCDNDAWTRLHQAVDGRGKRCHVRKDDLAALLIDQTRAIGIMQELGVPVEQEGAAQ